MGLVREVQVESHHTASAALFGQSFRSPRSGPGATASWRFPAAGRQRRPFRGPIDACAHPVPWRPGSGGMGRGATRSRVDRRKERGSRPVSRVLSWTAIHLGRMSPCASSDLPGSGAGHAMTPLFGLAPGGVYRAAECCHRRGALLPHLFTLAGAPEGAWAVCFLWHFPSARAAQALPGTLPCGARTFLPARRRRGCPADSRRYYTSGRPPGCDIHSPRDG